MIKPLNGNVFVKLDTDSVKRTKSGLVVDTSFERSDTAYGHIHTIDDETSAKWNLKVGDRVVFEKDRCEQITFKAKENASFIPYVLIVIKPHDILSVVPEEKSVLDYLG